ncbi:hypothetical protein BABINDRAFT_163689 [Babjeviella inositovora NRRL Y-12698]|uniref:U2 small nuclear ribonucleoprotein A' n=1 Tax=Babjeviella inositovora NRRL Y-12698 TaxID=984486 RepID=A0A1E3QHK5_9ASCO|nr:uncharacterized protein BABINDRAFT_163689 [Babjeviella inositovora NRRL Y-12698]ODQ77176.1 hypothetical protein BABINDRAFT_163689 [Babjeviella inositovora NRRL Y-12698]
MKLTPQLINNAPTFLNPQRNRVINLRGLQILYIENLGVTKNLNDVIDLTDNDLLVLGNFPHLPKCHTVLAAKNQIHTLQTSLSEQLPNLATLSLTSNNITHLSDLTSLSKCEELHTVALLHNPVIKVEHYRLFALWAIPSLKILDFEKIKDAERRAATALFGTLSEPSALATSILQLKSQNFAKYNPVTTEKISKQDQTMASVVKKLNDKDRAKLLEELTNATSLGEIDRIETALKNGYM